MKNSLLVATAILFSTVTVRSFAEEPSARQSAAKLDVQVKVQMDYLLYLPKEYDKQKAWPVVLFLHGAGERGADLEMVKKHGPPKLIAAGKDFPFIVVSPQCPKGMLWEPIELMALLDDIESKYHVDPDRVYVTGLSMGGFGSWRLAAYKPSRFAAIAPICGGGETYWAKQIVQIPTWAFHGAKDTAVSLERSQQMIDALKKVGGEPKLTIYPDAAHDSWTMTYDDPKFYEWLLAQKLSDQKPVAPKPSEKK
ncbi:MAG: dienelactone hydrolase family protein [Planctomycetia bacterium]|nr:dienelactone hydrolase family protein [Planctomycetia bacterium]